MLRASLTGIVAVGALHESNITNASPTISSPGCNYNSRASCEVNFCSWSPQESCVPKLGASRVYTAKNADFNMPPVGYFCGGSNTVIFWPEGKGPFHVVIYGHGIGGGVDDNWDWFGEIASLGLIVLAPNTGDGMCVPEFLDTIRALVEGKMLGVLLHPALAKADWSRTAIMGHSMGGFMSTVAGSFRGLNIQAMLASHGGTFPLNLALNVPSMFTTGTADDTVPWEVALLAYKTCPARPKVYANLVGGTHMETREKKRLNRFTARFLSCHVSQLQDHCDAIYGGGPFSLCRAEHYALLGGCEIEGSPSVTNDVVAV